MKTTIQIIDDNVSLTTLLAKTLAKFGYQPVVENNPMLAINTARHWHPDLILLDVMMPERDGGRVLADLRADLSLRYIPVVLLTGIAREAQALADTGGIRSIILSKPVQLKQLLNTIESEIAKSLSYNEEQANQGSGDKRESDVELAGFELPDFDGEAAAEVPLLAIEPEGEKREGSFSDQHTPRVDFSFPERTKSDPARGSRPW